ncbi:MAG: pitrilysin family protein [candidate division Zixibacteria bacterium]|nr:pitrilysin family protein [candidate division Zixibacteria bacterium]
MIRKQILSFVALAFLLTLAAGPGVAQDVDKLNFPKLNKLEVPEVEKVTLENGLRLYLLPDSSLPIFKGSARINCGGYLNTPDKVGLASICGTVLRTGGTAKWTGDEIDEKLEGIGGHVETYIGNTSGGASINVLSEYTDLGLEVLAEIFRRPVFEQDKVDLAKVKQRSIISRRNDEPMQIAIREFKKVIYGPKSPFARHTEHATINAIERQDLVDFHNKYFKPQNVQLAFWGNFDSKTLVNKIKAYFGDWVREGDPIPALPEIDYKFDNEVYYVHKADVNQTNIIMGHIGGLTTDEDYPDRIVMNNIFGGGFGSRMFNAVRSREGLAYSAFGVYTANISYPGMFYAFASTKSETTSKCVREMIKEIKRMQKDPPTKDEMRSGKDGYLNSFVFNFDSKGEVVRRLMKYDFYNIPDDFLAQEKEKVEKVSSDDVIKAAKANLRPDAMRIVVVGKGEDFDMPLEKLGLGDVTEIDITIPTGEEKKELVINDETLSKGKKLLDKAIKAHGGLKAYKNIKSVWRKATASLVTPNGEIPMPSEGIDVFPDKSMGFYSVMGRKIYSSIRNGNIGWKTDPKTMKLIPMTEEDLLKNNKQRARNTLRIFMNSDDPNYQAVYNGSGTVEGTEVNWVAIVDKNGDVICRFGFSTVNNELVCKTYFSEDGSVENVYSNLTVVNGVKVPMKSVRNVNGQKVMTYDLSEYIINGEIPDGTFSKPEE